MLSTIFTPSKKIRKLNRRHAYHTRLCLPPRDLLLCHPVGHSLKFSASRELCDSCTDFDWTRKFVDYNRQVYDEWKPWAGSADRESHKSYRIARSSFLCACCVLATDIAYRERTGDPLLPTVDRDGRSVLPERDAEHDRKMYDGKGKKKSVRFSTDQENRPEAEYRDQEEYCRTSPGYRPGKFADTTGWGCRDTSDPERALEAAFSKFWAEASCGDGVDAL